ncbi:acyltransferase [Solihabitans fulvus]|uniref:Acyltransferase n=1 Tax=Solihabitans fulvus TaxID=1892852 RepID=A0A5B2XG61_9PSEU|nr:acyltransferase [Solihabitans fulvus]KAA2262333.1 acyltransferase [Solihabitans fulvus]
MSAADKAASNRPRVESLTGLRWFAAFAVFLFHSPYFLPMPALNGYLDHGAWVSGVNYFGFAGVTFFFVLSGFVLTWSYSPSVGPGRFYWRRFARVWPMAAVSTLLCYPVFFANGRYPWEGLRDTLTLTQAWHPSTFYLANGGTWSLACEAFFYLLFPVIIRPLMRLDLRILGCLGVVLVLLIVTMPPPFTELVPRAGSPLYRLPEFLLGVVAGVAVRRGWRPPVGARTSMAAIGLALALMLWWFRHPTLLGGPAPFPVLRTWLWNLDLTPFPVSSPMHVMDEVFAPLFALCIAAVAVRDLDQRPSLLRSKPLVLLGKWSFSFYLTEGVLLTAAGKWIGVRPAHTLADLPWFIATLAAAIAVAAACYYLVEHPVERFLRGLVDRRVRARALAKDAAAAELAARQVEDAPH